MNPAWYGPIGTIIVAALGLGLQMWVKRVDRAQSERQAEREREANRTDIADKVSEVWERTSGRLDKDLAAMALKCESCELKLSKANDRMNARDRSTFMFLARQEDHDLALYRVLDVMRSLAASAISPEQQAKFDAEIADLAAHRTQMQDAANALRDEMLNR